MISFGEYPLMSLEEARKKAAEYRIMVQKGLDPAFEIKKKREDYLKAPTFAQAFTEYYHNILEKTPSGKERKRLIEKDCREWKQRKVSLITRRSHLTVFIW